MLNPGGGRKKTQRKQKNIADAVGTKKSQIKPKAVKKNAHKIGAVQLT
jgi:hypothetical protein